MLFGLRLKRRERLYLSEVCSPESGPASAVARRHYLGLKVVLKEGESVEQALRRLKFLLNRKRRYTDFRPHYVKPGYRRRQQEFFAKVKARDRERLRRCIDGGTPDEEVMSQMDADFLLGFSQRPHLAR